MSDHLGKDMRKVKDDKGTDKEEKDIVPLDNADIQLLRSYGSGPYAKRIKAVEGRIASTLKSITGLMGVKVNLVSGLVRNHHCLVFLNSPTRPGLRHWSRSAQSLGPGGGQTSGHQ